MKAVVQRVSSAGVVVDGEQTGAIGTGLLVLLGVERGDDTGQAAFIADKIIHLRIFKDDEGKMNRSLLDIDGEMLVVSQFTLCADCRKGRRPSFDNAAQPVMAEMLYKDFIAAVGQSGIEIATGKFGAHMDVTLVNDGPVTIILETP